jgi:ATP-binding cassette, subfamily C, bacterial CydD
MVGCAPLRSGRSLCQPIYGVLQAGELAWLRGDNQVGKSSLLLAMMGHLARMGTIVGPGVIGGDVRADFAPQAHALQHAEPGAALGSVADIIALQMPRALRLATLAASGIDSGDQAFASLSPGKKQRLLVTMAVLGVAPVVLLDEPTAGVDPEGRAQLWSAVEQRLQRGAIAIVVAHEAPPVRPAITWTLVPS